jgi:hypothetical protein
LLPELLRIFQSERHAVNTRCQTLSIFRDCVDVLFNVREEYPDAPGMFLAPIMPQWLQSFHECLMRSNGAQSVMFVMEIVQVYFLNQKKNAEVR